MLLKSSIGGEEKAQIKIMISHVEGGIARGEKEGGNLTFI